MSGGGEEKGSNFCLRCLCCCYCFLLVLIIIATGLAYYFYTVEKPKPPTYDVQSFDVKNMDIQPDKSLKTKFQVDIKTTNPNKRIAFVYGANSKVSMLYHDTVISSGKLPAFKQDPSNTTVLEITLEGRSPNEEGSLQDDVKNKKDEDGIPLVVNVEVPMQVFVGQIHVKEFMAYVTCDLVVDGLGKGKSAKVLEKECEPDVKL